MFKFFSRTKPIASLPTEPTPALSDEVKEQIVSVLNRVGFINDHELHYRLFEVKSEFEDPSWWRQLEYTELGTSMRFVADISSDGTFRRIHVVKHGASSRPQSNVDAANRRLAALIAA